MTEENVRYVMMTVGDKIPDANKLWFQMKLAEAPDYKLNELLYVPLHNSGTVLLLSIFLGGLGVDRFMIGDTGLGVGKLLLGWATCGLWPFIDIFCSHKKAKEKNFQKLMMVLCTGM